MRRPIRTTPFVRLFGKGRRERLTPLLPQTARLVRRFLAAAGRREEDTAPLIQNRNGQRLTRHGARYLLDKYVQRAQASLPSGQVLRSRVSPGPCRREVHGGVRPERRTVTTTSSPSLKSTSAQQSAATSLRRRAPWNSRATIAPSTGPRRSAVSVRFDRDVVLVARSGSNQHVWVVRRSLSEIVGRGTPWTASLLVHDNVMH